MSLDPTARETNVKDSVKKFFIDNFTRHAPVTFDRGLKAPTLQGRSVDKWISVIFSYIDRGYFSEAVVDIYCCTRQDNEGYKLSQLVDNVLGYLHDTDKTDGFARIPFYQSHPTNPWTLLGAFLVQDVFESRVFTTEDETKYKTLNVRLRFASKI